MNFQKKEQYLFTINKPRNICNYYYENRNVKNLLANISFKKEIYS